MKDDYASKLAKLGDKFQAVDTGETTFDPEKLSQFDLDALNLPDGYISQHIRDLQKPLYDETVMPHNDSLKELQKVNQLLAESQHDNSIQTKEIKRLREEYSETKELLKKSNCLVEEQNVELTRLRQIENDTIVMRRYAKGILVNANHPIRSGIISAIIGGIIVAIFTYIFLQ